MLIGDKLLSSVIAEAYDDLSPYNFRCESHDYTLVSPGKGVPVAVYARWRNGPFVIRTTARVNPSAFGTADNLASFLRRSAVEQIQALVSDRPCPTPST